MFPPGFSRATRLKPRTSLHRTPPPSWGTSPASPPLPTEQKRKRETSAEGSNVFQKAVPTVTISNKQQAKTETQQQ